MNLRNGTNHQIALLIISISILLQITLIVIVGSLGLVLKIPLSPAHLIISTFFAYALTFYLFNKENKLTVLFCIGVSLIIFAFITLSASNIIDLTYDGIAYQKLAVGHLKNGWTPPSETVEAFSKTVNYQLAPTTQAIWLEHYPIAPWVYGGTVYAFFNSLEAGKSLLPLLTISLFLYLLSRFIIKNISIGWAIILSGFIAMPPAVVGQIFSFYVDGILALSLYYLCISLIFALHEKSPHSSVEWTAFTANTVLCCNTKFIGIPFSLLFVGLIVFSICLISFAKTKRIFSTTLNSKQLVIIIFTFFMAILIIGGPVYLKNFKDHGNPFFPLMGKQKTDILSQFQPNSFKHTNPYVKFGLIFFSHTGNETNQRFRLKIPGTFNISLAELTPSTSSPRAGFGFLFSLICLFSIVELWHLRKKLSIEEKVFCSAYFIGCIIFIGIMDGSWMARYTPYLYALPLITLFLAIIHKSENAKRILSLLLILNLITFSAQPLYGIYESTLVQHDLNLLKRKKPIIIDLKNPYFSSVIYTLRDNGIKYRFGKLDNHSAIMKPLSLKTKFTSN